VSTSPEHRAALARWKTAERARRRDQGLVAVTVYVRPKARPMVHLVATLINELTSPHAPTDRTKDMILPTDPVVATNRFLADKVESLLLERDALRAFSKAVMRSWPHDDLDGGDLQDAAIAHGLLIGILVSKSCSEQCRCAEYYAPDELAGGVICYRPTPLLTGQKT